MENIEDDDLDKYFINEEDEKEKKTPLAPLPSILTITTAFLHYLEPKIKQSYDCARAHHPSTSTTSVIQLFFHHCLRSPHPYSPSAREVIQAEVTRCQCRCSNESPRCKGTECPGSRLPVCVDKIKPRAGAVRHKAFRSVLRFKSVVNFHKTP